MNPKFEIDKDVLGKTTFCKNQFECLSSDFPISSEVMTGVKSVLCRHEGVVFCQYKYEVIKKSPACICPVRNEIFKNYKK